MLKRTPIAASSLVFPGAVPAFAGACLCLASLAGRASAQEARTTAPVEATVEVEEALVSEDAVTWSEYWDDEAVLGDPANPEDPAEDPEDPEEGPEGVDFDPLTASLPGDQEASAVTPQALSLPSAEGSIEGMGESFSPILSSGTATYSVPIAIPAGRAGVQPTFGISYSSTGGNSCVGFGWGFEAPYIARQTDRGLPRYRDGARWTGEEDRFFYNGGQELVPVSDASVAALDDGAGVPSAYSGWQQYRARIEGAFMRFFRSPDLRRWAVQSPDGSLMEFGELPGSELPSDFGDGTGALQTEEGGGRGRVFRWFLTRMSDSHGSAVYYRYDESAADGSRYLRDVHYTSPASCAALTTPSARRACTAPLSQYGRRVRFVYQARPDVFSSYTAGWRVDLSRRLARIHVSSAEGTAGERYMVRRYHFTYYPETTSFHSLLQRVQVEGRPDALDASAGVRVALAAATSEGAMDAASGMLGPTLPPLTFEYSEGRATSSEIAGFGGIYGNATAAPASPPHSVDEGFADLFDVNSDGLPDLLVTDPARYRTPGGGPAAGVFFNGFSGTAASPATAGTFSGAVNVVVPSGRSGSFDLSNLNVVPMDIDGDGRSDLLHMPRLANYGYFMPTRDADGTTSAVSPRDQGWRFSYVPVALPTGVTDPRIDLGRDSAHIRAFDVNNDHLVDVVRTTGTVMQTWLNLGWLPEGEGRFGSATFLPGGSLGTGTWRLSTEPSESCLLQAGTPVDFEDPEVRLGDMDGDGIQDIVRIRRGRVIYWPGRGLSSTGAPTWGIGPQDCARGEGGGRYIEMATPPAEINVELDGVYIQDVNEDGAADVVQVRFDAIDVWFNRAGRGFTGRVIASGTPARPAFLAGRIRFADMDGSGTVDVLYGNANDYRWVDLLGGVQPRMLTRVDNGLGALTTLEYGSSAEEYLRDLRLAGTTCRSAGACRDRFTWSRVETACDERIQDLTGECIHRSAGSPVVVQVVTAVETTDRLSVLGRESTRSRTEYAFHDGYYEGFEQEFRGFGAADARSLASAGDLHPDGVTRSYFHQGRRPSTLATDRLADNPYESLKARVFMTESFAPDTGTTLGETLSTGFTSYTVRRMLTGLDGRAVWFAFAHQTAEARYDTSLSGGGGGSLGSFDTVRFEEVDASGAIPDDPVGTVEQRTLIARWGGAITLRSMVFPMDNVGHPLVSIAYGRVGTDQVIASVNLVARVGTDGLWMWRPTTSWVQESTETAEHLGETERSYDPVTGDLRYTRSFANLPATLPTGYEFGAGLTQANQIIEASSNFDVWGNATASCGGADLRTAAITACLRYGDVTYDPIYQQFPTTERIARRPGLYLTTSGTWDAGLGVLRTVTDPNLSVTSVGYDGFGRVTFVRPPPVAGCSSSTVPVQRFVYELTTNPASSPVSIVTAYQEHDCTLIGADTIVTRSYVDGLGRARATLSTAEESGSWIQSGISILNARGTVRRTFQAERVSLGVAPTASQALIFPATPYEESAYDAFDRPIGRWAPDGGLYTTTYHALTRDECDPIDNSPGPYQGTCTTMRLDGHGRVTDQVLRNRLPGAPGFEYYRLFTFYRADGAVTSIERTETTNHTTYDAIVRVPGHSVTRTFTYDTAGRRIGTTDPDSDRISGGTVRDRTWRYLFNRVGDLAAVRDSRGCGQNFYYDDAARLIAEDYIPCSESAAIRENSGITLPANAILMGRVTSTVTNLEVHYYFDAAPAWAAAVPEVAGSEYLGRLAGVSDRGQRSVMGYDDRGQVTFSLRQMRVIPAFTPTISVATDGRPVVSGTMPAVTRVYDTAHSYSRRATYDHGGRPTNMILPLDPDYGGGGAAPLIGGRLSYNRRGLPELIELLRDDTPGAPGVVMTDPAIQEVISELIYSGDGLVQTVTYGDTRDDTGAPRTPTVSTMTYDVRRRPFTMETVRTPTGTGSMLDPRPLSAVTIPFSQRLTWDLADNLTEVTDLRDGTEWPDGYRPQHTTVEHDALYRVTRAHYAYTMDALPYANTDAPSNWRTEALLSRPNDPMGSRPAPMIDELPSSRPMHMTWEYDWLGNAEMWNDDANQFYERSIGDITNGADLTGTVDRPGAIRIAHNLVAAAVGADHGGWLEVEYGLDGNVSQMTVHANCRDDNDDSNGDAGLEVCQPHPTATASYGSRVTYLRDRCICAQEQHYNYRWDELNRIAEAMRFDRTGGSGTWTPMVRQRYLYDSANERTVKQTLDLDVMSSTPEAVALYVYPGDFERRGLVRNAGGTSYTALPGAETQYVVGGARLVWRTPTRNPAIGIDRDQRLTIGLSDLIQSTSATLDLLTGELVETSNYYANGARESYRASTNGDRVAPEPMGFTGKEADEEVGLTYFGQRYLMSHLGRWASPDPLQTHAVGGGEALNGYHYVAGNVLQARDPIGLQAADGEDAGVDAGGEEDAPDSGADAAAEEVPDAGARFAEVLVIFDPARHGDRTMSREDRSTSRVGARWARQWESHSPGSRRIVYIESETPEGVAMAFEEAGRMLAPGGTLLSETGHGNPLGLQLIWDGLNSYRGAPMTITENWLREEPGRGVDRAAFDAWQRVASAIDAMDASRWVLLACDVGAGAIFMRELATRVHTPIYGTSARLVSDPGDGGDVRAYLSTVTAEQYHEDPESTRRLMIPGTESTGATLPGAGTSHWTTIRPRVGRRGP